MGGFGTILSMQVILLLFKEPVRCLPICLPRISTIAFDQKEAFGNAKHSAGIYWLNTRMTIEGVELRQNFTLGKESHVKAGRPSKEPFFSPWRGAPEQCALPFTLFNVLLTHASRRLPTSSRKPGTASMLPPPSLQWT